MKHLLTLSLAAIFLTACASTANNGQENISSKPFTETATLETPDVASIGDSADDPAIFIKNGQGFIAATDKHAGLYIYHLDGSLRKFLPIGPINNVDLSADPSGNDEQITIAKAWDDGMKPDLEGVTVYEDGTDAGYLLVSSQGNDSYAVFHLPDHQLAGRFSRCSGRHGQRDLFESDQKTEL